MSQHLRKDIECRKDGVGYYVSGQGWVVRLGGMGLRLSDDMMATAFLSIYEYPSDSRPRAKPTLNSNLISRLQLSDHRLVPLNPRELPGQSSSCLRTAPPLPTSPTTTVLRTDGIEISLSVRGSFTADRMIANTFTSKSETGLCRVVHAETSRSRSEKSAVLSLHAIGSKSVTGTLRRIAT